MDHGGGWGREGLADRSSGQPVGSELRTQFAMFAQSWTDARHARTASGSTARALSSLCHSVIQSRASSTSGDDGCPPSPSASSSGRVVFKPA